MSRSLLVQRQTSMNVRNEGRGGLTGNATEPKGQSIRRHISYLLITYSLQNTSSAKPHPSKPTEIYLENAYNDACLVYPTGPLWALNEVIHVKAFVSGFKYRG